MSRDIASMGYRPCVGVTLFNPAGLVFIGRRKPHRGNGARAGQQPVHEWQMPQGGIDPGEDPYNAALRELFEETNVRTTRLLAEAPDWYRYDLPSDVLGRGLRGRYRGQSQKWFALRFLGEDSEINVRAPGGGAHKPEFVDWRWEKLKNLPGLIVPFKRPVYERVVEAFAHLGG